jgi:hypothetical protein
VDWFSALGFSVAVGELRNPSLVVRRIFAMDAVVIAVHPQLVLVVRSSYQTLNAPTLSCASFYCALNDERQPQPTGG